MMIVRIVIGLLTFRIVVSLGWRWGCRKWSLPCPACLAWVLENSVFQKLLGTATTLKRIGLRPGQRVLEIGPGPGRLLLPAAQQVLPGGEVIGIDIQQGMLDRLTLRAIERNVTNLKTIQGDATQPHVPEASCDVVILAEALGEITDRAAVLAQCFRALKPGGVLSVTEIVGDPHYQFRSTVKRFAEQAGFRLQSMEGSWRLFTANFVKPD